MLNGIAPVKAAMGRLRLFVKRGLSLAPQQARFATQGLPGLFAYGDSAFDFDAYVAAHAALPAPGSNRNGERSRCMSHTVKRRCVPEST